MQYNTLWALAYAFASAERMPIHRVAQFAADYARTYEYEPTAPPCATFVALAAACDFHYHG